MLRFPSASAGSLPRCVRSALLLFFTLTGVCVLTELFCHFVLHLRRPYDWPLPPHANRFCDFLIYSPRLELFHTPGFFTRGDIPQFTYPPGAAAVLSLYFLSAKPLAWFLLSMVVCIVSASILLGRKLLEEGLSNASALAVTLFFALSYPVLLALQQANCEWIVCLVLSAGLWAFIADRPGLAAVLLGIGAAIKLYPVILLALFISRRQYRWLTLGVVVCALFSAGSMWLESGSFALSWAGTVHGIGGLNQGMILQPIDFWDHSLFELFKKAATLAHPGPISQTAAVKLQKGYLLVMAATGIALFFIRIRKMSTLNQIFGLVTASILLPPMSMDYTLMQLSFPSALLILSAIRTNRSGAEPIPRGARAALLTIGFLFAPLTEIIPREHPLSSPLRILGLITLFAISIRYPLEAEKRLENADPGTIFEAGLAA